MNVKAIAGYLDTNESEIVRCEEWATVFFVHVKGFRPCFVSKKGLAKFIAADARRYNPGQYLHGDSLGYCKSYGACPVWNSPENKAKRAELAKLQLGRSIPLNHPAAGFLPAA
jgi:hypothetical protein